MTRLTAGQQDFLKGLLADRTLRRWGMERLAQRHDVLAFLKPMLDMGFFDPKENPGPVPSDQEGTYRIPRWEAMIYLEKAAIDVGEENDLAAAQYILKILREVTDYRGSDGNPVDNYTTWHSFAKALSALPVETYSAHDLEMLRIWLGSKFDRGMMIGIVLGSELLPKLLASTQKSDWNKALVVISEATTLIWRSTKPSLTTKEEAVTAVDPYWLRKLFEKHAKTLGEQCSPGIADLLTDRVAELFTRGDEDKHSWLMRPAIEDHPQNHDFRQTHNVLINALRDVVIAYTDKDEAAAAIVGRSIASNLDIIKRIAIHVMDERLTKLTGLFTTHMPSLLKLPLIHETYRLLKRNFSAMAPGIQTRVLEEIQKIDLGPGKEPESQRLQSRLVHAIHGQGNASADGLHATLKRLADWDREDTHPDFLSYMTSWSGPGPSRYSIEDLKRLDDNTLIQTLNSYEQPKGWQGPRAPTVKALTDALAQIVKENPTRFIALLPRLLEFKPAYQYAVLDGFRDLSHRGTKNDDGMGIPWEEVWKTLLEYVQAAALANVLITTDEPEPAEPLTPTRRWLVPVIADLIRNGTHDDHRVIPSALFPSALSIIAYLLREQRSEAEGREEDAMTEAINATKGRCIEALFDLSLYICREADQQRRAHTKEWIELEPLFNKEIANCKNANFEFSTLCGAYLANIYYLNSDWLARHIEDIFPKAPIYSRNFDCALQGFAYMPQPTKAIYALLREQGIFHIAIERVTKGRHAREKLLQHISVAYLWGDEQLDRPGSLLGKLIEQFPPQDVREIVRFLWGTQSEQLSEEQVQRVLRFWAQCMARVDEKNHEHRAVLSDLGLLTTFLKEITDEYEQWLLRIAPVIGVNHNTDFFIEYLEKLADVSPRQVGEITLVVVRNDKPYFDFENRYESIIKKLFKTPYYKLAANLCNQPGLIELPQINAIYNEYRKS